MKKLLFALVAFSIFANCDAKEQVKPAQLYQVEVYAHGTLVHNYKSRAINAIKNTGRHVKTLDGVIIVSVNMGTPDRQSGIVYVCKPMK